MSAPFLTVPLRLDSAPEPAVVADLFRDLDDARAEVAAIERQLHAYRQKFMDRERMWCLGMADYRREIERRAGQ